MGTDLLFTGGQTPKVWGQTPKVWGQTPQILNTTEGTVLSNSKGDRPL